MDFQSGLLMFFIGCTVTIIGFTIENYHFKEIRKKALSSVEESLRSLNIY